ncbi:hypothetical protein DITRI_Ditri14bG0056800 [Diplodiscus trichospermus]
MALYSKDVDSALHGAGAKPGLEIWCIENLRLVPVSKSSHGKFYSGSAYVVLSTSVLKSGPPQHDIRYWLGNDANEVDSALASDKALELDAALGSCTVHGCNSSIQERAKALEEVQYIKENKHTGKCEVATIEDGKLVGDSDVGEFWSLFGGYAPIPRDAALVGPQQVDSPILLFWINLRGKLSQIGIKPFDKGMLENDKCYMLDCGAEVFVWMGRNTSITERKTSISTAEDFLRKQDRSNGTHLTFLTEGLETSIFRSYFNSWPKLWSPSCMMKGEKKWLEDRADVIFHLSAIVDSARGDPAQVTQDREPVQFFLIFQTLIVYKGGISAGYKKFIVETGIDDDTYDENKTTLFRVRGTSPENMQAIQVNHPAWQPISVREGTEPDSFWSSLGGKTEYPREKEMKKFIEDPHLFKFTRTEGKQIILSFYYCSLEGYFASALVQKFACYKLLQNISDGYGYGSVSWLGLISPFRNSFKQTMWKKNFLWRLLFMLLRKAMNHHFSHVFFDWDPLKANMHGNSFERKLATLKGKTSSGTAPARNAWKVYSREATPDGSRSRSGSLNGSERSVSPASSISGSHSKSSDSQNVSSPAPVVRKLFTESSPYQDSLVVDAGSPLMNENSNQIDASETSANLLIYSYHRLTVVSIDPVSGIDVTKERHTCLRKNLQKNLACLGKHSTGYLNGDKTSSRWHSIFFNLH